MSVIRDKRLLLRLLKDINDVRSALRRVTVNLPLYDINNENTPAQITADQNNYVIGNYDVLRVSTDVAGRTITGLKGGVKGRDLRFFNVGSYEINLSHQSALSNPENRIISPTGFAMIINTGEELSLYYDETTSRWISSYSTSSDRISCQLRLTAAETIPNSDYTAIPWDSALVDTGNFFNIGSPTIVTFPESGWYHHSIQVVWDINGTNLRELFLTDQDDYNPVADSRLAVSLAKTVVSLGRPIYRNIGDTIFARVWQNSGGPLDILVNKNNVGANNTYTELNIVKL